MRVTPDTAILIRTNTKATGSARELLDALKRAGAVLVLSPFILGEVERDLRYPRADFERRGDRTPGKRADDRDQQAVRARATPETGLVAVGPGRAGQQQEAG